MMIWTSDHAAIGAAALLVGAGAFWLVGDIALATLCWIPAAVLTFVYMSGPADDGES